MKCIRCGVELLDVPGDEPPVVCDDCRGKVKWSGVTHYPEPPRT